MVHLTGSNNTEELKHQFSEGLEIAGKYADPKLISNVIRIFKNIKRVHWNDSDLEEWFTYGFHYVYLATEAISAELEPLLELVQIDEYIGYSCEDLELFIFRFKALKIINNDKVGL